jgi:uncharacterized protein
MKIDLTNIPPEGKEVSFRFSEHWWQPESQDDRVLGLASPLSAWIKVEPMGKRMSVEGSISAALLLRCDRCLEAYSRDLSGDFRVFLSLAPFQGGPDIELSEEDLNLEFIQGNTLDVDQLIVEQIILSLPMKSLCSDSCRGLCPVCGCNLNSATCSCTSEIGTPLYQHE